MSDGQPKSLDAERARLREAGYTDNEISQILINRAAAPPPPPVNSDAGQNAEKELVNLILREKQLETPTLIINLTALALIAARFMWGMLGWPLDSFFMGYMIAIGIIACAPVPWIAGWIIKSKKKRLIALMGKQGAAS